MNTSLATPCVLSTHILFKYRVAARWYSYLQWLATFDNTSCSHHHATFFSLVQVVYLIYLALAGVSKAVAGKAGVTTSLCHKRPSAACPDSPLPLCAVALVAPWVWALQ
jgi:hypothetical protein